MAEQKCGKAASYRYTWPGRDESFICEEHASYLRKVAGAMGFYCQLIPLDNITENICEQYITKT